MSSSASSSALLYADSWAALLPDLDYARSLSDFSSSNPPAVVNISSLQPQPPYTPIHSPKPVFAYKTVNFDLIHLSEDDAHNEQLSSSQKEAQRGNERPKTPRSHRVPPQPRVTMPPLQPVRPAKRRRESDNNSAQLSHFPDRPISKRQRLNCSCSHITVHIPPSSSFVASSESSGITPFDPSLAPFYPSPSHLDALYGTADWNPSFWRFS